MRAYMHKRYLTKSTLMLGLECPTKLFYAGKKEYANLKLEDSFLEGLAENGYQVAELARCYHPGGILVDDKDANTAAVKTKALLEKDHAIIFEAAFVYKNFIARTDIIIKNENSIALIEVKSKSFDSNASQAFLNKKGSIYSEWRPYLYDVAYQKYILSKANPDVQITCYLMLPDKNAICPSDGLNQKFKIIKKGHDVTIKLKAPLTQTELENPILKKINIDSEINHIFSREVFFKGFTFEQYLHYLSEHYCSNQKIKPCPGKVCKTCEFKANDNSELKSGFEECWRDAFGFDSASCKSPMILDIWKFNALDKMLRAGTCKVQQIDPSSYKIKPTKSAGLSSSERQWLQIEKMQRNDTQAYFDVAGIKNAIQQWQFPLHFIDFETIKPAIPFYKGERPYHDIAFQFSHHIMYEDGKVKHAGQYINTQIGKNPNIDFIRKLKDELDKDEGTIFRYAAHENTYLNKIYQQLMPLNHLSDQEELLRFIKSISVSSNDSLEKWQGKRNMVDLRELILKFYYDPLTNGSNSIKHVLPAVLKRSKYLQEKYSKPIYGKNEGIFSLNFKNMRWVQFKNGNIVDPYCLLPKLFQDIDMTEQSIDFLFGDDNIKAGGAASIAYARLQFCEMSAIERNALISALLKYCELDTLAMVMVVEFFQVYPDFS